MGVVSHLQHRLRQYCPDFDGVAMGFAWPSHCKKAAYARARSKTERAATHLAAVVRTLRARGFRVALVGHSMGCRVALLAMRDQDSTGGVDAMVLLGAAVPDGSLADGEEFARARIRAESIVVLHSRHDATLGRPFAWGEAASLARKTRAMGRWGVRAPCPVDCVSVDVSDSVPDHNPNLWLLSNDVMQHVMTALFPAQHLLGLSDAALMHSQECAGAVPADPFAHYEDLLDAHQDSDGSSSGGGSFGAGGEELGEATGEGAGESDGEGVGEEVGGATEERDMLSSEAEGQAKMT